MRALAKWVLFCLFFGAITLASAGVGNAQVNDARTHRIEIPIFEGGGGVAFFSQAAREYEKIRPDVSVDLYGDPRIADQVRVRVLEGSYPDASDAPIDYWSLISAGDVMPMDSYLDGPNWEGDGTWRNSFVAGALQPYVKDGKTYGIPLAMLVNVIWYNPVMFAQHGWRPPATWDEFFRLCDQIRAAGIYPLAFQGRYPYYAEPIFASACYGVGGMQAYQDFRDLHAGAFNNPIVIRALSITQHFSDYFQPGALGMSHTEAQMQFLLGRTAMIPCGDWLKSEMEGKIPEGFHFAAFNLPAARAGQPPVVNAFANYYFVFSPGGHPKETVDFLRFLTSRDMAGRFSRDRDIPTAVRGANKGNLSSDMSDIADILEAAKLNYGNAGEDVFVRHPEMGTHFDDVFASLLAHAVTPALAAGALESAAATVRSREVDPSHVAVRHLAPAILLLSLIGAAAVIVSIRAWRDFRRFRGTSANRDTAGEKLGWGNLLLFTLPAVLIYGAVVVVTSMRALYWSFYTWNGISDRSHMVWVGLLNFRQLLLESDAFWSSLNNNLFLMFVTPLFVVPLALFLAACLSRGLIGSSAFRIIFFFPNLLGTVASTLLWMHLYNPQGGLINSILCSVGLKQFSGFAWLSADHLYWAIIPMSIWTLTGFNMVLYLAAMQNVPGELYEAAGLEGASHWRQFWTITLPMIREVLAISSVFMILAAMKAFDVIWLLTNQRPSGRTNVIATRLVQTMFSEFDVGHATAMAVILFLLVFLGSALCLRAIRSEDSLA
jgi:ABC-type sugar transport system permease subunit/ABC-type glycerol-3-phosphate transport system substrate-binding protein